MKTRKIIHCDCDSFFASVEIRDDPSLEGKPVAVGGATDRRGVVATCNYIAREYGVHSAMASAHARKLCPELIIVPPQMEKYKVVSKKIREIFDQYTPLVEPLSLDEAFLDVSETDTHKGSATFIAQAIRQQIKKELNITVSAGVAPNKFLAKIASDWNKPDGLFVITPDEVDGFVKDLPAKKIFGVGKVTERKLIDMGIKTCGDLQNFSVIELSRKFGSFGLKLHELSRGQDDRPVVSSRHRKSLSVERTFPADLPDIKTCQAELPDLTERLNNRMETLQGNSVIIKAFVKIKFLDFSTTSVEHACENLEKADFDDLLIRAFIRGNKPVRLIGVGVGFRDKLPEGQGWQLELFEDEQQV